MGDVLFDPLIALPLIYVIAAFALGLTLLSLWRGLGGWWLRGLAAVVLLAALLNPSLQTEDRETLSDIVIVVVDETASQRIADRSDQTADAFEQISAAVAARPNTDLRVVQVTDAEGDAGTTLMTTVAQVLSEEPRARVAGIITITDGQVHDTDLAPDLPAPLHVLLTGREGDWDRRLQVNNAPAFAILGEEVLLGLRLDDQGAAPVAGTAELLISVDGEEPLRFEVPVGEDLELPITLPHGGMNVIQFETPSMDGELTDRNNVAVVQINGVRDRLRVLLVSGEPHAGERTWRNLLKSDSSVDLVHFTILRPPNKQDGVPVDELSLIAFPTRELFLEKVDEFDLIIFDRYKRRGILPSIYIDSIRDYVTNGGAVLIAAGPDFASADSLYRSPLADILPASPTARVIEDGFRPTISELGAKHPVTKGLDTFAPAGPDGPEWGRWFRQIELSPKGGQTVMEGIEGKPLLVLDRVGEGRVALLASDHAWLWNRGFEGGGPQLELLRRLAHWMMKEPELEEETLFAQADGQQITIIRRSLLDEIGEVTVTGPDGTEITLSLEEVSPGRFEAVYDAPEIGLYRLAEGDQEAVIALGPTAPREFINTIATQDVLSPTVATWRGGIVPIEDGIPSLRNVSAGRVAAGRGWIGLTPRDAYLTADVRVTSLVPAWLLLLIAAMLSVGAWLREGRRS
ncbi:hypothetical protein [Nereida sp. MMG025]|uniref:DUF7408 domain-containing protein n=1 Tax=Nereida sp. MMG025 TaxID=2909981 RepID=UPI001F437F75|nr:hypothetical protein [Nereida sp. MMG025]MCF6445452.1 hypothetical protein [Nereida sp. MMG025]